MGKKAKSQGGRPPHVPTDDLRTIVELLVASGVSDANIARKLKISVNTLKKHYPDERENGWTTGVLDASKAVFEEIRNKTSDKRLDAAKFFLSRRGRGLWSETKQHEISGPNGGAIPVATVDLDAIDFHDLETIYEIIQPAMITAEQAQIEEYDGDGEEE